MGISSKFNSNRSMNYNNSNYNKNIFSIKNFIISSTINSSNYNINMRYSSRSAHSSSMDAIQYTVNTRYRQHGQVHLVPELEDPYGHCQSQPVILRDPEATYVDPGRMRLNKGKRPPPPPRRSEETQLSNSAV